MKSRVGRGPELRSCLGAGGDMEVQHLCEKDQSQLLPQPQKTLISLFTGIRVQQAWGEGRSEFK